MAIITTRRKSYSVIYDVDGKRYYETYCDYKIAKRRKEQIDNEIYHLSFDRDTPFLEYLYLFVNIKGRNYWSIKSYENCIGLINNYLSKVIYEQLIKDVNDEFIIDLFERLKRVEAVDSSLKKNKYITSSNLRKIRTILYRSCEELIAAGSIDNNPASAIKIEKEIKHENDLLISHKQVNQLLKSCDNLRLFIILHLIIGTDIKINEMLCLTIEDLHISDELYAQNKSYITINKVINRLNLNTLQTIDENTIIDKAKNKGFLDTNTKLTVYRIDERSEKIPGPIVKILREYVKGREILNQKYLFSNKDGGLMDRRILNKQIYHYLEANDIPHINMSQLRKWSHQIYKDKITNREYFYSQMAKDIKLPNNTNLITSKINLEIKESLPNDKQNQVDKLVDALNNDEELKMKLIHKLKELK